MNMKTHTAPKKNLSRVLIIPSIILAFILLTFYTIWDNNRVVIVTQEVKIKDLPAEFEGFTILQLSDLHGKEFGGQQQKLVSMINSLDYDLLAITGDMSEEDDQPFFDLLDGIENKEYAYYATGNWGPYAVDEFTGEISEVGRVLESKGVHNLKQVYRIQRGDHTLYVSDFALIEWLKTFNVGFARQQLETGNLSVEEVKKFQTQEKYCLERIDQLSAIQPEDVLIGITHYPFSIDSVSTMPEVVPQYDLVLAGHYHGGQIRLPLIGAIYVPDAASERRGFFPAPRKVSGLYNWGEFQQYISRGLGSSSMIPFLRFRLFNPPEINLITLVSG